MSQTHRIEDAVFEEIHELSYEVWTLPREDAPAQPAITGISTIVEAFQLMEHYGGNALFYVRDSRGRGVTSVVQHGGTERQGGNEASPGKGSQAKRHRTWRAKAVIFYFWFAAMLGGAGLIDAVTYALFETEWEGAGQYFLSILILIPVWRVLEGGRK